MKRVLAMLIALVMVLALCACGAQESAPAAAPAEQKTETKTEAKTETPAAAAEEEPIRIGILIPLSGGSATSGITMKYVAELIKDEINNDLGGIQNLGGRKIELVYGDTATDATTAISEFERMCNDGVEIFIGGYNSPVGQALSPYVIANDKIMIMVNCYANGAFTEPNDNVWHVSGTAATGEQPGVEFKKWQRENLEGFTGKRYGYIYTASDYGRDAYEQLVATKEASGVEEIYGIPVESGVTDLSSVLLQLKEQEGLEYLSCAIPMSDAILFLRQCEQYEVKAPIFGGGSGLVWADLLDQVGSGSNYIFSTGTYFGSYYKLSYDPALAKEYSMACKEAIGWLPDENYSCMWGDMWTLWDALERTASLDLADVKAALRATNITGEHKALLLTAHDSITLPESFTGPVTGNVIYNCNPDYTTIWAQAYGGEWHIVYPERWKDPDWDLTYPVPDYSER